MSKKYKTWSRLRRRKNGQFARGNHGGPGRPPAPIKPAPPPFMLNGKINPYYLDPNDTTFFARLERTVNDD